MRAERTTLTAADGYQLSALRYRSSGPARAHLVVGGATGVPQGFYKRFAEHAARRGFEQHRITDACAGVAECFQVLGFAVVTRYQRHAGSFHQRLGRRFAAHGVDGRGGRAEEDQACRLDGTGEAGVF